MVELRKLTRADSDILAAAELYSEAFNRSVYPPFEKLLTFSEMADVDIFGIYAQSSFSGFLYSTKGSGFAYMMYMAMLPKERGKGLGSQALQNASKMYENYTCVLDIEPMGSTPEEAELFRRRKELYLRNGFLETGHSIAYSGLELAVFSAKNDMDFKGFKEFFNNLNRTVSLINE